MSSSKFVDAEAGASVVLDSEDSGDDRPNEYDKSDSFINDSDEEDGGEHAGSGLDDDENDEPAPTRTGKKRPATAAVARVSKKARATKTTSSPVTPRKKTSGAARTSTPTKQVQPEEPKPTFSLPDINAVESYESDGESPEVTVGPVPGFGTVKRLGMGDVLISETHRCLCTSKQHPLEKKPMRVGYSRTQGPNYGRPYANCRTPAKEGGCNTFIWLDQPKKSLTCKGLKQRIFTMVTSCDSMVFNTREKKEFKDQILQLVGKK